MYVKKRVSLLLFAALAMVLFTACGRWDFSREAAKAANEAQNAVVFEASTTLAQSMKDALEDKVQISDVKAAMEADERLDDLLGRLDVYAVEGDDAEAAAQTIAENYIKHISGRQSDGHIAMVKADNGWFYAAVVTTTTGSSGSGSGSGSGSDDGDGTTTPDPEEPGGDEPGTENKYTVSWTNPKNGTITVTTPDGGTISNGSQVAEGTKITITVTVDTDYKVTDVTAGSTKLSNGDTYTVNNNVEITATIEEKTVTKIEVIDYPKELTCNNTLDRSQIKIKVTYDDDTSRVISASDASVKVEHDNQNFKMEGLLAKSLRKSLKLLFKDYSDEIDRVFDTFTETVGNKPENMLSRNDAYWDAKFNVTYKEKSDAFNVELTCGKGSSSIFTILCDYCPNWDGETNTAPSTRSLQSAHFDTES